MTAVVGKQGINFPVGVPEWVGGAAILLAELSRTDSTCIIETT